MSAHKTAQKLDSLGSDIDVNKLSNGLTSIDFYLYDLTDSDTLMAKGARGFADNQSLPTQRSGGLFKSSIVLDAAGTVREYNFRLPPVSKSEYTKQDVRGSLGMITYKWRRNHPHSCVFIRAGLDSILYPHVRGEQCRAPPKAVIDFLEFVVTEYDRSFDQARDWAPAVILS